MAVQLIRTPSLWGELREGEMSKRKGRHRLSAGLIKINQDGGGGGHVLVIHFRCRSNQPTSLKRSVKTRRVHQKTVPLFLLANQHARISLVTPRPQLPGP